jgi:putative nucleotidyltransferase with HDIG domain
MRDLIDSLWPQNLETGLLYPPHYIEDGNTSFANLSASILVVDDDAGYRKILQSYLQKVRLSCKTAPGAIEALEIIRRRQIDLVIADIKMKGKNGIELMQEAHHDHPNLPFIIITGYAPEYSYEDIIEAGASDFIAKPFSMAELNAKVNRIYKERDVFIQLQESLLKVKRLFENTVSALIYILEKRDPYTAGHQQKVAELACAIGQEMRLPEERIEALRLAGFVHDIGKVNIPMEILIRPRKLNNIEKGLIQEHCQTGFDILKKIDFPYPIADIVLQHHERVDGSGYPQGLMQSEILLEARILAVADVVEAMSDHRPYRPALKLSEALKEISLNRAVLYDGEVVDACLRLFKGRGFSLVQG